MGAMAVRVADDDIRDKIRTVLNKLDRMESRVKSVESVAEMVPKLEKTLSTVVPKLEKTLEKVTSRVESTERRVELAEKLSKPSGPPLVAPPPIKAFVSGASIGFLIVGAITAAWVLGFF